MYVNFKEITARKVMKFKDPETGYVYLLRAYEAQGVDEANRLIDEMQENISVNFDLWRKILFSTLHQNIGKINLKN